MVIDHGLQKEKEIYLEQILDLLRATYGYDCWVANGFLKEVHPVSKGDELASEIETLAISGEGVLYYNKDFWEKYIDTPKKVIEVITHELLHKVFGDFSREYNGHRELHNLAADSVINSTIFHMLGHADLMVSFYKGSVLEGILRPYSSAIQRSKFKNVYSELYDNDTGASVASVFSALKLIMDKKNHKKVVFLGTHVEGDSDEENEESKCLDASISADDVSKIAMEISKKCRESGYQNAFMNSVISLIESRSNMRNNLLRDFSVNKNINKITDYISDKKIISSVFPTNPSRRDLAMLACGITPVLWRNTVNADKKKSSGLAVYLDVSGSMYAILPKALSVIRSLRKNINRIFQFSNQVTETSFSSLLEGHIKTTGGTDFNCIIEHAVKNDYSKIIVFSDGYADITEENKKKCKADISKACMILIEKSDNKNNFISKTYNKTYYLDDLC